MRFDVGQVYNRRCDIHQKYGGQRQGGMSTPRDHPVIFLFTGDGGIEHGYQDRYRPDGVFEYTGEGQRGDMAFVRANRALRDHQFDGKRVYLFEAIGNGNVRFVGDAVYLGHRVVERDDTDGNLRKTIVFELDVEPARSGTSAAVQEPRSQYSPKNRRGRTLAELRQLALARPKSPPLSQERRRNVQARSNAVRAYVLKRASGTCEGCDQPAPFKTKRRQPYLEPHHTTRLADGGPDHPGHVIALCPTCHRRVHHADDGEAYNMLLVEKLKRIEAAARS